MEAMQNPNTGDMFGPGDFRKEGETVEQTAARHGFPIWTAGEVVTLKGVNWIIRSIIPGDKQLVLEYCSKAKGIEAIMQRLEGQKRQ